MPKKRLSAKADRALWEKITKGRAGLRWDSVVEKIWKDMGGNQQEILFTEKFGGYRSEVKATREGTLGDIRAVMRRDRNENVFARPNGLRENAETAISCRGPGPARKNRRNNSREEEEDAQMCPYGKPVE